METRYYQAQGIDIERLADELERTLMMQGDQVQHFGNKEQMTVQVKKGSDIVKYIGMQSALTLTMQRTSGGVVAMIGQQKWVDKAAVGVVGLLVLWPLALTAGAGAYQQSQLGSQVMNSLDMLVRQQVPDVKIGPAPLDVLTGVPTPYAQTVPPLQQTVPTVPPLTNRVACAHCQTENEEGARFCMNCGQELTTPEAQKTLCPSCGVETKPNAALCTACGTSLLEKSA